MTEDQFGLTERELHELEKFLDVASFEIHLERGDITLTVNYQPASNEGSFQSLEKTIASVSLQKVVEYDVARELDDLGELDEPRAPLAMIGGLRKAADFIEKKFTSYLKGEWQPRGLPEVPRLLRIVEEDGEKEEGDVKSDESEAEDVDDEFITNDELASLKKIFGAGNIEAQVEGEFVVLFARLEGYLTRFAKIPIFALINDTADLFSQAGYRQELIALIGTLAQMQRIAASYLEEHTEYDATAEAIDEEEFLAQLNAYRNPHG